MPSRDLCSLFSIFISSSEPNSEDDRKSDKDRKSSYADNTPSDDDSGSYNFWH
jgi:hypothetical protein